MLVNKHGGLDSYMLARNENHNVANIKTLCFVKNFTLWWKLLGKLWDIFYCSISSRSMKLPHVSMHVLWHESVIKLHFVLETFSLLFLFLPSRYSFYSRKCFAKHWKIIIIKMALNWTCTWRAQNFNFSFWI